MDRDRARGRRARGARAGAPASSRGRDGACTLPDIVSPISTAAVTRPSATIPEARLTSHQRYSVGSLAPHRRGPPARLSIAAPAIERAADLDVAVVVDDQAAVLLRARGPRRAGRAAARSWRASRPRARSAPAPWRRSARSRPAAPVEGSSRWCAKRPSLVPPQAHVQAGAVRCRREATSTVRIVSPVRGCSISTW